MTISGSSDALPEEVLCTAWPTSFAKPVLVFAVIDLVLLQQADVSTALNSGVPATEWPRWRRSSSAAERFSSLDDLGICRRMPNKSKALQVAVDGEDQVVSVF